MNDPGLDESIGKNVQPVDDNSHHKDEDESEDQVDQDDRAPR